MVVFLLCFYMLKYLLALDDFEITFLRDTERDTICSNIGLACFGGCAGVKCTDDNEHLLEMFVF